MLDTPASVPQPSGSRTLSTGPEAEQEVQLPALERGDWAAPASWSRFCIRKRNDVSTMRRRTAPWSQAGLGGLGPTLGPGWKKLLRVSRDEVGIFINELLLEN